MAELFQSLLDKINEEGVQKAQAKADEIIAKAHEEAKTIKEKAHAAAKETAAKADEKAEALQKRAEAGIRQAARDILLELQRELERRIQRAVGDAAQEALSPEFMAALIKELAAKFTADPDGEVTVLAAVKDVAALDKALKNALAGSFKTAPKILGNAEIRGGMEVSFKGDQLYCDFSSEAVTELVGAYIGPRLAVLLADQDEKK